ncbi:hypothetical protein Q8A73_016257 [Channa argus]|nr:hypothetical protein Q8A73_016257 [Channa argus]
MLGTLCSLITALTCVSGVTVVTQKPPVVSVRKGDTVTMDCNLGTGVDAVIVLTQTPAVHTASPGQEVVLKCNIQRYDGNYVRWYKQVPGSSLPPPVLTVFPPSSTELQSNKVSLVCLSSQSVPFADVTWLAAGSPVSSGISTSTAAQQPDQTFQISSYLEIQTSDWNMDKVYTCKVSLGSQSSEKNINKSNCPTEQQ